MNKKRIAITLFMAFLSEIANKIVPLVTLHMVALRLGTKAFGTAQFSLWLVDWGVIFTTFGFMQVAPVMLRDAASADHRRQVATDVVSSRLFLALVAAAALVFIVSDGSVYSPYKSAIYASGFILISTALDSTWLLLARQKMAILSAVSIAAKLVSVAIIAWMIHGPDDAVTFVMMSCAVNAVISITSCFIAAKEVGFSKPSFKKSWKAIRLASPFALAVLMIVILERFDLYLVERELGLDATGIYSAASKLVTSLTPIIASVTTVFYSEMLAHQDLEGIYRHLRASLFWVISLCAPIAVGIWMIDTEILRIVFGDNFTSGAHSLSILTFGAIAYAIILIFGFQLLALRHQWRPLVIGLGCGSVLGFVTATRLLTSWGNEGVALAAVIGKWTAAVIILTAAIQTWKLSIKTLVKEMARPSIPAIIMGLTIAPLIHFAVIPQNGLAVMAIAATVYALAFSLANAAEAKELCYKLMARAGLSPTVSKIK
jgi:O-antigen/teichoic acid export membrane protein